MRRQGTSLSTVRAGSRSSSARFLSVAGHPVACGVSLGMARTIAASVGILLATVIACAKSDSSHASVDRSAPAGGGTASNAQQGGATQAWVIGGDQEVPAEAVVRLRQR